jgi:Uma2 family endonuclease
MTAVQTSPQRYTRPDRLEDLTEERLFDLPRIRIPATAATYKGFLKWMDSAPCPLAIEPRFLGSQIFFERKPVLNGFGIPASAVASYKGFCKWIDSGAAPEKVRFSYMDKEVIIDMSPEELETHNKVKQAINLTVGDLNRLLDLGEFYPDGAQLSNDAAGLSTQSDAVFVSWRSFKLRKARLVPRKGFPGQFMRIEGTPDWVMEVLSRTTVSKDLKRLRKKYHRAGIREYWIIDARGDEILFEILVHRRKGYVAVRMKDGWQRSEVFQQSFRLIRWRNRMGWWSYKLEVAPS